jgi:hypothetical protein
MSHPCIYICMNAMQVWGISKHDLTHALNSAPPNNPIVQSRWKCFGDGAQCGCGCGTVLDVGELNVGVLNVGVRKDDS